MVRKHRKLRIIQRVKKHFLYKKFIKLRIHHLNKDKIYNFKKRKWKIFIAQLRREYFRESLVKKFDHLIYFRFRFSYYFNNRFRFNLYKKQKFKHYFGGIKNKNLKKLILCSTNKFFNSKNKTSPPIKFYIMETLENKLYMVLYRSFFARSIRKAKQLIVLGDVYVNNKKITVPTYTTKKGDLISFKRNLKKKLQNSFHFSMLINENQTIPKYLKINYSAYQILLIDNVRNFKEYNNMYPYLLETNYLLKHRNI